MHKQFTMQAVAVAIAKATVHEETTAKGGPEPEKPCPSVNG